MQNYFVILFLIFLAGLVISTLSPSIYRKYYPKKTKAARNKILVYRPAFILIFLALMSVSAMGWQDTRYGSVSSADTAGSDSYVKSIYPIYNNRYDLAKVIDNNTVVINIKGQATKVKLIGVEKFGSSVSRSQDSCFSKTAETKLNGYLKGGKIQLEGDDALDDKDKNDVLLRYALVDDKNINKKLIAAGYATASSSDSNYRYLSEFKKAQETAKDKKLGFWSGNICKQQPVTASTNDVSGFDDSKEASPPGKHGNSGNLGENSHHSDGRDKDNHNDSCGGGLIRSLVDSLLNRCD